MPSVAILLAAGAGERLGLGRPKAFVELAGRPLLTYAVRAVEASDVDRYAVVVPPGWERAAAEVTRTLTKPRVLAAGGATRQESVRTALEVVAREWGNEADVVVCHDVARPFAGPKLFAAVMAGIVSSDGVVPALPLVDTVKRVDGDRVVETLPREGLVTVQTPQAFRRSTLEAAHRAADADGVTATDDAALLERAGYPVAVVDGDPGNLKVTGPADLELAEWLAARDA